MYLYVTITSITKCHGPHINFISSMMIANCKKAINYYDLSRVEKLKVQMLEKRFRKLFC